MSKNESGISERPRGQFRIRTLFIVITLLGVLLGVWVGPSIRKRIAESRKQAFQQRWNEAGFNLYAGSHLNPHPARNSEVIKASSIGDATSATIPQECCQWTNLRELSLEVPGVSFPDDFGQLENVRQVDLWRCELNELPRPIAELTGLSQLSLYDNNISSLPFDLPQSLVQLDLARNRFTEIPTTITKLENLEHLRLSFNRIGNSKLPFKSENVVLRSLDLDSNNISELNSSYWNLRGLRYLDLSDNPIANIPTEFSLKRLRTLTLQRCSFDTISPSIYQATNLTALHMEGNNIRSVNPVIGQLRNLKELSLDGNKIESLPNEIGQLQNLKELSLSGNKIDSLPNEIGNLKLLRKVNLDSTSVDDDVVTLLAKLPLLKRVFLKGTNVTSQGIDALQESLPRAMIWSDYYPDPNDP